MVFWRVYVSNNPCILACRAVLCTHIDTSAVLKNINRHLHLSLHFVAAVSSLCFLKKSCFDTQKDTPLPAPHLEAVKKVIDAIGMKPAVFQRNVGEGCWRYPKTWECTMLTSTDCQPAPAGCTISDGNMKEDIKVWDWSPLLVIPWKSRQLEESTSLALARVLAPFVLSGERAIPSERDWSPPTRMPGADGMNHAWRGSLSAESSCHCRAASDHHHRFDACHKPDEKNRSRNNFKAMSMSPQDDPAQSSISPCSVSSCLVSLYHPAKNVLINITGKRSASCEELCLCQNCPPFLFFEIFILITVSQRGHILPQNTPPPFKPTRQFSCFNSKVVPTCQVLSVVSPFITIYQAKENVPGKR